MNKKIYILLVMVFAAFSCSDDDSLITEPEEATNPENNTELENSIALRATLENIKNEEQLERSAQENESLCFQFEYPIVLEYNNETTVTVDDYNNLLNLLLDETLAVHIVGIGFPFNIVQNGQTQAIANEAEFQTLVTDCGYDMVSFEDVVVVTDDCFNINYPITVFVNEQSQTFNSQDEAQSFFLSYTEEIDAVGFDYPFGVTLVEDGSVVTVNDDFELVFLIEETCGIE
jgi:hypothetical protein